MGACFFAFSNHFGLIPIIKVIKEQSDYNNYSALFRSHYFPMLLYTTVSYAGYISFGNKVPDFILVREPIKGSLDIMFSIG